MEGQQAKLKEVRDRLDRISRDDNQYLELATQEHRMLQVGSFLTWPGTLACRVWRGEVGALMGLGVRDLVEEVKPEDPGERRAPGLQCLCNLSTPGELGSTV